MKFKPKAKLDPSQVTDKRFRGSPIERLERMLVFEKAQNRELDKRLDEIEARRRRSEKDTKTDRPKTAAAKKRPG